MIQIEELYSIFLQHPQVTTDSRDCPEGSVFFALKGESFDGNAYARTALDKGCSYAVVDERQYADASDRRFILVDNALQALQKLANYHRLQFDIPVIAITGTNGKTTTKELVAAVLSRKYNVLYTQGNFNNHIGVPKTLLSLGRQHEIAVIEMGANHPGEIKTLAEIAEPNYGLITNVGKAHLLGFGSFEGVIRTKGELYDYLREHHGKAFINENNPYLMGMSDGLDLIKYGDNGYFLGCDPYLYFSYCGNTVCTQLIGAYNMDNVLAAACVGDYFGLSTGDICSSISAYEPSNNRSQLVRGINNTLIVDAYNANPTSMKAAIDNFHLMRAKHKMLILGDMKELGGASLEEHTKILNLIGLYKFRTIWFVGEEFHRAACAQGTDSPDYKFFANVEEVKKAIPTAQIRERTILIKGSNSMKLYTLAESL